MFYVFHALHPKQLAIHTPQRNNRSDYDHESVTGIQRLKVTNR